MSSELRNPRVNASRKWRAHVLVHLAVEGGPILPKKNGQRGVAIDACNI